MSFSIQTNVNSIVAQENLRVNQNFQSTTIQRLTSGYRINSSADDAAGLAVANKFRSDTAELTQGVRNANDGLSQLQIVDGGLNNISQMLDRMKTLATEAATSTFSGNPSDLNGEYTQLLSEIDREASNIGLNSTAGGSAAKNANAAYSVYVGGGNTQTNAMASFNFGAAGVDTGTLNLTGTTLVGGDMSHTVGTSNDLRSGTFLSGSKTLTIAITNINGGAGTAQAIVNGGSAGLTGSQILQSLNGQLNAVGIDASLDSSGHLTFSSSSLTAFTVDSTDSGTTVLTNHDATQAAASSPSLGTGNAQAALTKIETAVGTLSSTQATFGAAMNTLNYAVSLANSQIANFSAAESRIRDADVASEAANLTKAQVLQQASMAAMAQANSAPQAVLSLLRG